MSELADLVRRVENLEARAEIAELTSAYAVACDEHDMPRLESLFAEDATFDSTNKVMVANGRAEIVAMFIRLFKIRGPGYHWTHDHFVRFNPARPDRATGLVLSHAETCPGNEVSLSGMRYNDDYRRVDGCWVFQKRVISFLYYVPAKDYAQALNGTMRFTMGGNRMAGDYPESLPAWQAFDREHGRVV